MKRSRGIRIAVTILTLALAAALCVCVLALYSQGRARRLESGSLTEPIFTREAVAARMKWVAPLFALWLAAAVVSIATGRIARPVSHTARSLYPEKRKMRGIPETSRRVRLRAALYAAALLLLALGLFNGGLNDVLVKAVNICTECIGLG